MVLTAIFRDPGYTARVDHKFSLWVCVIWLEELSVLYAFKKGAQIPGD